MKKENYFFTIFFILIMGSLSAQTKWISHKSHSGSSTNFSLKEDGNLGIIENYKTYDEEKDSLEIKNIRDDYYSSELGGYTYDRILTKEGLWVYGKSKYEAYKKNRKKIIKYCAPEDEAELKYLMQKYYKDTLSFNKDLELYGKKTKEKKQKNSKSSKDENKLVPFTYLSTPPNDNTPLLIGILSVIMIIMGILIWKVEVKREKIHS